MNELIEIFPTERQRLYDQFSKKLEKAPHLNRQLVSFQANKEEPVYRWFKYKEGFSSGLVRHFLTKYSSKPGKLLDPFAGVGTTLFAGQSLGWESYGIEILPVGIFVMQTREALSGIDPTLIAQTMHEFWANQQTIAADNTLFSHIPITKDAFPADTEVALNKFLHFCNNLQDTRLQTILRFAAFTILEEISYTRKDGQYLRWDFRSKRDLAGKPFDKGKILSFEQALKTKTLQIIADLGPRNNSLFEENSDDTNGTNLPINIIEGSCLEKLPTFDDNFFDFIITSPPYCNRYDYTRTYALELVYLGSNSDDVRNLRQQLLSCTVENKEKLEQLKSLYSSFNKEYRFDSVLGVYNSSPAMTEVNTVLSELNKLNRLNNANIPRMVRNYFLEMCFVIFEMARITRSGGYSVMVNDNVRYGGEEIPVDLILSEFAEAFGFETRNIFVLPRGKGNSSQQMGQFGRTEIRKCVYLWQKK